ncbi:DUF3696 domain-containing protein [Aequorivita sediminis]|uniref:DUF3696 domain-containing protein n=1 Tax=Aequorivita sediminis TaxID=3073653 RepID=UPI0028AFB85A|nr:DUF3696 domain-containing protein [Aequorivita sp. F6058]
MITKIGIENFRIFRNYNEFDLAPLTVLTGPNNSGKSSMIKMLSLLKNSFNKLDRIQNLNFDGGNHNLGTFEKVFTTNSDSNHIKIKFDFPLNYFDERFEIELTYRQSRNENGELISIKIFNNYRTLIWVLWNDGILKNVSRDYYYSVDIIYIKKTIDNALNTKEKTLFFDYFEDQGRRTKNNDDLKEFFEIFESLFSKYYHYFDSGRLTEGNYDILEDYIPELLSFNNNSLLNCLEGLRTEENTIKHDYINQIFERISSKSEYAKFQTKIDDIFLKVSESYNEHLDKYFYNNITKGIDKLLYSINSIEHISAQRGSQQRILSDLGNNEINKTVKEYFFNSNDAFLKDALKVLGIKGELKIEREEGIVSKVYLIEGDSKLSLADLGFGYSQIIPILLKIITVSVIKENEWYEYNPYSIDDIDKEDKDYKIELLKSRKVAFEQFLLMISKANEDNPEEFLEKLLRDLYQYNSEEYFEEYDPIVNLLLDISDHQKSIIIKSTYPKFSHVEYDLLVNGGFIKELKYDFGDIVDLKTKPAILIIEEPEANLHPNLQSKLADILVMAHQELGIHFILETHSEYLIRKLQYLVAKNEISQDDVTIYYFNSDEFVTANEKKVKEIKIDEFGGLTDTFGPGFFDEATQLQFELYKLNQAQNN